MTGKAPIPKAWFEPVQVSRINQIDTLLSINLFVCVEPPLETIEKGLSIPVGIAFDKRESENPELDKQVNNKARCLSVKQRDNRENALLLNNGITTLINSRITANMEFDKQINIKPY